ncbi:MAG: tetratricopeptide repeat protein [Methylococcaceae bacterium]
MIRKCFTVGVFIFCTTLSGCGGGIAIKKTLEIENAESYTKDGLQAFSGSRWDSAQRLFVRALSLYEGIDDQHGVLLSRINLAEVTLALHNYPASLRYLDLATKNIKKSSRMNHQSRITLLYARIALQQQKTIQAESILQSLLPEFDRLMPMTPIETIHIAAIAVRTKIAFVQKKDEVLWTNRYAKTIELSGTHSINLNFRLLRFQSDLLQQQKKYAQSESNLLQSLTGYKMISNRLGIAATLLQLGQLNMAQGHWQVARNYFDRSVSVFRYLKDLGKVIQLTENLMKVEMELGDLERVKILNQALISMKAEYGVKEYK